MGTGCTGVSAQYAGLICSARPKLAHISSSSGPVHWIIRKLPVRRQRFVLHRPRHGLKSIMRFRNGKVSRRLHEQLRSARPSCRVAYPAMVRWPSVSFSACSVDPYGAFRSLRGYAPRISEAIDNAKTTRALSPFDGRQHRNLIRPSHCLTCRVAHP